MKRSATRLDLGALGVLVGCMATLLTGAPFTVHAASPCDHAYFPVAPTIRRKYETTYRTGMPPLTHVERITDVSEAGFTQQLEFATTTVARAWTCTADGLSNSEPGNLSAELRMKTEQSSGVTLIPVARLKPGAVWQRHYDMRGTMPVLDGSTVWGTLDIHFEAIGPGAITVPAGTFEAMKISFTQVQRFTMKHEGNESPLRSVLKGTLWYVQDVGLVKTEIETAAATDLVAFKK